MSNVARRDELASPEGRNSSFSETRERPGDGVIAGAGRVDGRYADFVFAWPQAQLGVMGAKQAVTIVNRRAIAQPAPGVRNIPL